LSLSIIILVIIGISANLINMEVARPARA
jgi:hypothetical protein